MGQKRKSLIGMKGTVDVEADMHHWSQTVLIFGYGGIRQLDGFNLLKVVPGLPAGHGIKLRVTVEVMDPGTPCPVRYNRDGKKCTEKEAKA